MEVEVTNQESKKPFIEGEKVKTFISELLDALKSKIDEGKDIVEKEVIPIVRDWITIATDTIKTPVVFKEVEFLTKDELVAIVKENIVPGSNGNIVYKKMFKDGTISILISYLKDNAFLPVEKNVNVNINAEGISRDVKEMFGNKDIIILK